MKRCAALFFAGIAMAATTAYQDSILEWRKSRDTALRAPDGWTSLAGLFWLHEGANSFGADPASDVPLPAGPAHVGTFELHGGKIAVTMDGQKNLLTCKIDPEVAGDVEMLQDLIVAAASEAIKKVDDEIKQKMGGMLGGMGLPPGLF